MIDIVEKPNRVTRALLVGVRHPEQSEETTQRLLEELVELVRTLGIEIAEAIQVKNRDPQPRYLIGSGKAEEVIAHAKLIGADCIVLDSEMSPGQQRNWEALSGLCVIDRQEVILDIFKDRAHTKEAVLQVELARAEYSLPRLKNAWGHLSRQRGGGGVTQRGECEAQIELDSRIVRHRIARLKEELEAVIRHRHTQRKQRQRVPLPTAAIVGYTNAGKSSLLNILTGSGVLAENKLFATLDPTTRQLTLPHNRKMLVTDTVGFVRRLPHRLVEAFKATLEEAVVADFLIHVLDVSSPEMEAHRETTLGVLNELGAGDKRILTVYNKVDLLEPGRLPPQHPDAINISSRTGQGLDELLERLGEWIGAGNTPRAFLIPHTRYDVLHQLHVQGAIEHEEVRDDGIYIIGRIPPRLNGLIESFAT